jgi:hypothetical protein
MEVGEIRKKLSNYNKIQYNDPHVTIRCLQREISKEQIEKNTLNPENLVLAYTTKENPDKYELYFKLNSNKTLKLVAMFKKDELYIITVIMRWRKWQNMIKRF